MARRIFAVMASALVALIALAAPASAHTVSGVGATNWRTTIGPLSPALPGLTVRVVENGSRLELVNHGPDVVVFGYQGEPYLRVGPAGVFINTRSPAAYLNCSRTGCPVPATADATAAAEWQRFSTGQTVRWHDHRIHWMGQQLPADVARAPGVARTEFHWTVAMAQGATAVTASGALTWVPGTSPVPWLALALVFAAGVAAARSWRWLAVAAGVVSAVDLAHAVGVAWFWAGGWVVKVAQLLEGSSYQLPGWILGALAVRLLLGGRSRGRPAAIIAGASALVFTGLLDITVLSRSEAPFAGSIWLDRVAVAACLGMGLGVVAGGMRLLAAERVRIDYVDDDEDGERGPDAASPVVLPLAVS